MDNQLERDGKFTFSGTPSSIYDYYCFDDQSSEKWLQGSEYKENESEWDEEQKEIWHFFYRPYNYGHLIGKVQRSRIDHINQTLQTRSKELSQTLALKRLSLYAIAVVFVISWINGVWVTLLFPLTFTLHTLKKEENLTKKIEEARREKLHYQKELDHLLAQQEKIINERPKTKRFLKIFWERIQALEANLHLFHFGEDINKRSKNGAQGIPDFYSRLNDDLEETKQFDYHPINPVVLSWGLLQPLSRSMDDKKQATGIKAASMELHEKVATFRKLKDGTPFYRFIYIQFLFFRPKNLNVVSLCYDLITKKKYNVSVDTFQYNHITSTSYSEEDISYMHDQVLLEELGLNLPMNLVEHIYGSQTKVISFSSTSGTSFRCVLPDEKVTSGLEDWMLYKQQLLAKQDTSNSEENHYKDIVGKTTNENTVINKLAEHSIRALRKRCEDSTGLSEYTYLKEKSKVKGRAPFEEKSRPNPYIKRVK